MEKGRGREGLIARVGRVFGAADGLVCDISCYLYIVVIFFSSNFLSILGDITLCKLLLFFFSIFFYSRHNIM